MILMTKQLEGELHIIVKGVVASIKDTADIKSVITQSLGASPDRAIKLMLEDTGVLPSSMIGFLLKVIQADKAPVAIIVRNRQLYRTITRMKLLEYLNVTPQFMEEA